MYKHIKHNFPGFDKRKWRRNKVLIFDHIEYSMVMSIFVLALSSSKGSTVGRYFSEIVWRMGYFLWLVRMSLSSET